MRNVRYQPLFFMDTILVQCRVTIFTMNRPFSPFSSPREESFRVEQPAKLTIVKVVWKFSRCRNMLSILT